MKVMKFGGGCLKNSEDFLNVCKIIKSEKERLAVVLSAVFGVTDLLNEAIHNALISEKKINETVGRVQKIHFQICKESIKNEETRKRVQREIEQRVERLRKNLYGVSFTSEITDSLKAMILSYGERLSAFLLAGVLNDQGIPSRAFESDKLGILTDESYDNATAVLPKVKENLRKKLLPYLKKEITPVICGYFGCTPSGKISLFGRNGSDYSASVVAYALNVSSLEIWKDVDGFMTADPKIVNSARMLNKLSYNEAAELSYFGAKILHPRTVEPISAKKIPILIKNLKEPEKRGTLVIHEKEEWENVIKSVTYNKQISILRIYGAGVGYKPGIISEIGGKLSDKKINIYSIITSQTCINLIIDRNDSDRSYRCLKPLEGGVIEKIEKEEGMALIAVVGEGISKRKGIAGRVFSAVAREGVNIEMMSGGASDVAYYFIVKEDCIEKVINAVHSEFF